MIKVVLLDLDNTLLTNPDHAFAVEYLGRADRFFEALWGVPRISRVFIQLIGLFNSSRDGIRSNTELAHDRIAAEVGRSPDEVKAGLDAFYSTSYPELESCVQKIAAAAELVNLLREKNYGLVVATNPIYPESAVYQRLNWAGLSPVEGMFAFITHSGNMHFAKPDPAYYAEILGRVGVEPDEALMVGDSLDNDIHAANLVGIHTYHISRQPVGEGGSLAELSRRIRQENWLASLTGQALKPSMIEPQLRGNIGALFGMLADVKDNHWYQRPDPEEWSITQILCHLLESERTIQLPRLKRILNENNPFIVNPRPPGPDLPVCDEDGLAVARRFVSARQETLAFLQTISPESWSRPARHSIFGLTTLLEMSHFTAQHDRLHLNQLCQTMGKCED